MKPIIPKLPAIDLTKENRIPFYWKGTNPYGHRLFFYETNVTSVNDTQEPFADAFYEEAETTMQLFHTLTANHNVLKNGKSYYIRVQVYETEDKISDLSDQVLLYCRTTPNFKIEGISDGQSLQDNTAHLQISYSQKEDEPLKEYEISLYDDTYTRLASTGTICHNGCPDYIWHLSGLVNHTSYYLRASGSTLNDMPLDTGFLKVCISYKPLPLSSSLTLKNDDANGVIKVSSNILSIGYRTSRPESLPRDPIPLDLTGGNWLSYDENVPLADDFVLTAVLKNPEPYQEVLSLSGRDFHISVTYMIYQAEESTEEPCCFFWFRADNGCTADTLYSPKVTPVPDASARITLYIKRQGDLYDFQAKIE